MTLSTGSYGGRIHYDAQSLDGSEAGDEHISSLYMLEDQWDQSEQGQATSRSSEDVETMPHHTVSPSVESPEKRRVVTCNMENVVI